MLGPMGVSRACQQGWLATLVLVASGAHIQDHIMDVVRNLGRCGDLPGDLPTDGLLRLARHLRSFFDRGASLPGPACWPELSM